MKPLDISFILISQVYLKVFLAEKSAKSGQLDTKSLDKCYCFAPLVQMNIFNSIMLLTHRVDRVLQYSPLVRTGLQYSPVVRIGTPRAPSHPKTRVSPFWFRGDKLVCERGGGVGGPNSGEWKKLWYARYIFTLCFNPFAKTFSHPQAKIFSTYDKKNMRKCFIFIFAHC
jgi:hypothetical protein